MFLENNPLQILLDLLVPKHNLNYSSPSQYLTNSEILKIKKLEKDNINLKYKGFLPSVKASTNYYDKLIQDLIIRAKFSGEIAIATDLARLLEFQYSDYLEDVDLITFVPPDPKRYLIREYHLPLEISKNLSELIQKPMVSTLQKRVSTKAQTALIKNDRLKNLENVFILDKDLELDLDFKTVLLLDDVCTTGTTLGECSKILFENFEAINLKHLVVAC
jgi:ComF family protein